MKSIFQDVKKLIEDEEPEVTLVELDSLSPIKKQVEFLKDSDTPSDPSATIM
jgi:hypothetical protein